MGVDEMILRIEDFEELMDDIAMEVVEDVAPAGVVQIKQQLLNGEDRNGEPTSPGYSDDPYFKNADGWKSYVAAKEAKYGIKAPANGGVNLIWNGSMLQDYLTWYREGKDVVFEAVGSPIWDEVVVKWGAQCFAPNGDWIGTEIVPEARVALVEAF